MLETFQPFDFFELIRVIIAFSKSKDRCSYLSGKFELLFQFQRWLPRIFQRDLGMKYKRGNNEVN